MSKTTIGNGHHKDFEMNLDTDHGARLAREEKERMDAKEAYKDEYKTHTKQVSRDCLLYTSPSPRDS